MHAHDALSPFLSVSPLSPSHELSKTNLGGIHSSRFRSYRYQLTEPHSRVRCHSKNSCASCLSVPTLEKILRASCTSAESIFVVTPLSIASNAAVGSEMANGCYIDVYDEDVCKCYRTFTTFTGRQCTFSKSFTSEGRTSLRIKILAHVSRNLYFNSIDYSIGLRN